MRRPACLRGLQPGCLRWRPRASAVATRARSLSSSRRARMSEGSADHDASELRGRVSASKAPKVGRKQRAAYEGKEWEEPQREGTRYRIAYTRGAEVIVRNTADGDDQASRFLCTHFSHDQAHTLIVSRRKWQCITLQTNGRMGRVFSVTSFLVRRLCELLFADCLELAALASLNECCVHCVANVVYRVSVVVIKCVVPAERGRADEGSCHQARQRRGGDHQSSAADNGGAAKREGSGEEVER